MTPKIQGVPLLVILAGPNGAGKSTFYQHFLAASGLPFVNADRIARELAPTDPAPVSIAAAQLASRERWARLERGESFIFETVFSDPAGEKLAFMKAAQIQGYAVTLVFIGLENSSLSQARVSQRVASGGHNVPAEKVRQRFPRTLANLGQAVEIVDRLYLFDNSQIAHPYRWVAFYERGSLKRVGDSVPIWARSLPGLS